METPKHLKGHRRVMSDTTQVNAMLHGDAQITSPPRAGNRHRRSHSASVSMVERSGSDGLPTARTLQLGDTLVERNELSGSNQSFASSTGSDDFQARASPVTVPSQPFVRHSPVVTATSGNNSPSAFART